MSKEEGVSSDGVESGSYEHKAESPPSENVFPPNSLELSVPQTKAESITRADPPSPLDPLQVKEETPRAHDSLSQEMEARLAEGENYSPKLKEKGETENVEKKEEGEVDQCIEEKKEKIAEDEDTPDQEVNTRENDAYHEHILNLLKIQNNSTLNSSFYEIIPTLSRKLLLNTDLSANTEQIKSIEEELLPPKLLKNLPGKDPSFNYYQQYCQLTIANMVMQSQIKKLIQETGTLKSKVHDSKVKKENERRKQEAKMKEAQARLQISQGMEKIIATSASVGITNEVPSTVVSGTNSGENNAAAPSSGTEAKKEEPPLVPIKRGIQEIDPNSAKGKRIRRPANAIERLYRCTIVECSKSYGSEGSLHQHMKMKHADTYYANHPRAIHPPAPS